MPSSSRLKEARSEFQPISRRKKLLYLSQTQGPEFQVESELGKGSLFSFSLPVADDLEWKRNAA